MVRGRLPGTPQGQIQQPTELRMPETTRIEPVANRKQQKEFVQFAWDHYRGDPNWIPPLRDNHRQLLGYKYHPFYDRNQIQTFLAKRGAKTVGRIAAIIDWGHNERYQEKRGMFGFFESIEDQEVANALFDAARQYFQDNGLNCMRGPNNPSLNNECGLLIEGFEHPPTFMMTYNKPYYASLIENYGFEKTQDLYAYWGHVDMLKTVDQKMFFIVEEAKRRFDMTIRRADARNLAREVDIFLNIYNQALSAQWGFVPLSDAEARHVAKGLKHLIVPEMTSIIEIDNEPVGVAFGMLDYNPIIKEIDGRLFPFGFLKIRFGRKKLTKVRLVGTYVVPKYQKWGLGLVLMNRLIPDCLEWGIQEAEFSWVLESNKLSRGTLERGGAIRQKSYRMYDYDFPTGP